MENFTPTSRVLVTGANGHVAQHVISQLFSRPAAASQPIIRATVRSQTSAAGLKQVFSPQIASGKLELVFIPDIAKPGSFDEAVKDCTHIAHIASPLVVGAKNAEQDVLIPAIRGTESLVRSALDAGTALQAVVITSSFAACFDAMYGLRPGYTYTPKDWNPISYGMAADPNLDLSVWPERYQRFVTYMASKKLAEKAAWDLYHEAKPPWRLSVVCPTYIGGPSVLPLVKGADSLSFSNGLIWKVAISKPNDRLTEIDYPCWVDVRDVAKAHIEALVRPAAEGKRFILSPIKTTYAQMAALLRDKMGLETSTEKQDLQIYDIEDKECEEVLGMDKWVSFEKMVLDTVKQVQEAEQTV
jgi:nucleoside-diphosphate-sugar epimerase